jgi:hypothetical protein
MDKGRYYGLPPSDVTNLNHVGAITTNKLFIVCALK